MSEQRPNQAEIDLYYFFKPVGTVFKKIWNGITYVERKVRANFIVFAAIVLLVTLAGYSLRYFIKPSYQTHGIFISNILPGKYCSILLKNLNSIKGGQNNSVLAQQLKIPVEAAKDIQSISMADMRDTFLIEKKDSTLSLFKITLTLGSVDRLDTIQRGLINYLENNEYALKRKEAKRKALMALKENLSVKMESLDSLKKIVNSSIVPRSEARGIILGEPVDPVSVYQVEMGYYREQLNIDQSLATIDNIEVIQPFFKINQPNFPRYNRILAKYFLVSLVIATLVVLLLGKKPKPLTAS
jgi:hypothetical protein